MLDYCQINILACGLENICEDLRNIIPKAGIDPQRVVDIGSQFHSGDVQVIITESPIKGLMRMGECLR